MFFYYDMKHSESSPGALPDLVFRILDLLHSLARPSIHTWTFSGDPFNVPDILLNPFIDRLLFT